MLLANFIAIGLLLTVAAFGVLDTRPARAVLYSLARSRHRRRHAVRGRSAAD